MTKATRYLCVKLPVRRVSWREGDRVVVQELPPKILFLSVPWIRRRRPSRRKIQMSTITVREGEGLIELEQALDAALLGAQAAPRRHVTVVIDLDLGVARQLRNALQLARLNGVAVQ